MLVNQFLHLLASARDAERIVFVSFLDLGEDVPESLDRNLVRVRCCTRQNNVHALHELL